MRANGGPPEPARRRDPRSIAGAGGGHRLAFACAALAAATLIAFSPVREAQFLQIDDQNYVTANPEVLRGVSLPGVLWALTSTSRASNWHPLTWISHMVDVTLFGTRPEAHHAVNVALHAFAVVLLLVAFTRATGRLWPCLLAVALFALHPLRVESVAWVAERKDVLAGLMLALVLLAYLRYARSPSLRRYLGLAGVFALGLMAKPTLVSLPGALLLLDWWPLGRLRPASGPGGRRRQPARAALEKLPLLALSAAAAALTWLAQRRGGALSAGEVFPFVDRVKNALLSSVWYGELTLWPRGLISFYPHRGASAGIAELAAAAAILIAASATAWALRASRPWLLAGSLWYLGTLVPMLGLVQAGLQGTADRYSYLPAIGLSLALAGGFNGFPARPARAAALGGVSAVVLLGALTQRQATFWKDTVTLFTHVTTVDSRNYVALNLLGASRLERGEAGAAAELFARSLAIRPSYATARYNLALALTAAGRGDEAIGQLDLLLRDAPRDAEALFNRGRLLAQRGEYAAAARDLREALAFGPDDPAVRFWQARALAGLGRTAEAERALERAVRLDPEDAGLRAALAELRAGTRGRAPGQ